MIEPKAIERIHAAALELLAKVGVAFFDTDAVDLLVAHGCSADGHRVRLGERLVDDALSSAPRRFTVAGRRPERDLHIGGGDPVLATASGPPFIIDRDGRRGGTLADVRDAVALAHLATTVDAYAQPITALDVPEEARPGAVARAAVLGTDKVCRFDVTTAAELEVACDISAIIFGAGWHERPTLLSVINTTSPLQLSADASRALLRLAALGQPVCLTVCAMGGATGPVTLAGLLAQQHAELLAGLVLTQLVRPGCPFLYGATSSLSSMRNGVLLVGVPEYWTLTEAAVALGHALGLPVRAGGAITDAHTLDAQAGFESALGLAAALAAQVDFTLHATGILSSFNAYSPAKFVVDDAIAGELKAAQRRLAVDDETLALDVTAAVGPGGTFLDQRHTRRNLRASSAAGASLMSREPYETWLAHGERDLGGRAWQRVDELLAAYEPPGDLDPTTLRQLDTYCGR
jgi:trimethylamine--corrinoid protein Co-methyltransferase